jgi:hypothetical protein
MTTSKQKTAVAKALAPSPFGAMAVALTRLRQTRPRRQVQKRTSKAAERNPETPEAVLNRYLTHDQIALIAAGARWRRQTAAEVAGWGTAGENRAALESVRQTLWQLAQSLRNLSARERLEMEMASMAATGDYFALDAAQITAIYAHLGTRIKALPEQSYAASRPDVIRAIVEATGMKPSIAEHSRFFRVAQAVFELEGVRSGRKTGGQVSGKAPSPKASIQRYLRTTRAAK